MTVVELNRSIADGSVNELIRVAEARQVKALARIADRVCEAAELRLLLVAGGSSAGKTTTAKRLCTQFRVNDRAALHLSTDDYFVGDAKNPRDEQGNLDYEHVECVDIKSLAADVNQLLAGDPVPERRFDFVNHVPSFSERWLSLPPKGVVVLEGIHAMNPRLTEGISDACKFRVFVEPRPTLEVLAGIVPDQAQVRFLRRLVRDNQFRKVNPSETIRMWPNVLKGELKWIRPYVENADAFFDSYLEYELAVLKPYVGGLLERARHELGELPEIVGMLRLLNAVDTVSPNAVPGDSIIRETIGGSQLEY